MPHNIETTIKFEPSYKLPLSALRNGQKTYQQGVDFFQNVFETLDLIA